MAKREVKVAAIQSKAFNGTKDDIVGNSLALLEEAGRDGVEICCLGELFNMEYNRFLQGDSENQKPMHEFAESIPGPTTDKVAEICKKYKMYVIAPIFENAGDGIYYNSASVIDPDGKLMGVTRKRHISSVQPHEKVNFKSSDDWDVYEAPFGKFAVGISSDNNYPETVRTLALNGCELYFNPVAESGCEKETYEVTTRMRAIDNAMYAVFINRCGDEGDTHFIGESVVCDPWGKIVATGNETENAVVSHVIDLENVNSGRIDSGVFRDRRTELYGRIAEKKNYRI